MEREFITKAKKDELEAELEELKTTKRAEILERLAFAKSFQAHQETREEQIELFLHRQRPGVQEGFQVRGSIEVTGALVEVHVGHHHLL